MIPLECVNGKGRLIPERKPSKWLTLTAPAGFNEVDVAQLFLTEEGKLSGQVTRTFTGYAALEKRRDIRGYSSLDDYLDHVTGRWPGFTITADSLQDLDRVDEALVETSEVSFDKPPSPGSLALNPFFSSMEANPFKATERHYPIDFGTTERNYSVISLHYPPGYRLASMPRPTNLALPDRGGRYIVQVDSLAGLVVIKALMERSRPNYLANQYGALKQLYNLIVQSQRAEVVFAKNDISR